MDGFGTLALIGLLIFVCWFFEGSDLHYEMFGKSLHKQRLEKEKITMNNILWNYQANHPNMSLIFLHHFESAENTLRHKIREAKVY